MAGIQAMAGDCHLGEGSLAAVSNSRQIESIFRVAYFESHFYQ